MTRLEMATTLLAAALTVAGCSKQEAPAEPAKPAAEQADGVKTTTSPVVAAPQPAQPTASDYADPKSWLCRPGREDTCSSADLSSTVVKPDGTVSRETWSANPNAQVDCFYVYPTVSLDTTPNSDMQAGDEERGVTRSQAARFGSVCRVYAPLYRQFTLPALRAMLRGEPGAGDRTLAYADVASAFKRYMEHDNAGRGVVLIGHSQGASMLVQLLQKEIDGKPIQKQLVSALLIGTSVHVPKGKDVGGSFQHTPLCRSPEQLGCVVSYASFRANVPPPGNSRFGKSTDPKSVVACTNPAALAKGNGELQAYLPNGRAQSGKEPPAWVTPPKPIDSPFVSVPGLLSAKCVQNAQGSYLAVSVKSNSSDPRTDDIAGDVISDGKLQPDWGLHVIDMHLAMGNLVSLVGTQAKRYSAR